MSKANKGYLIWIDLEMTGLDYYKERIIEIATVITDSQLNVIAEGPSLAIHQPDELLAAMDDWNTRQHAKSGLTKRVRSSVVDEATAEKQTLEFLRQHVLQKKSPMCGNSIYQDRCFLHRYMPDLEEHFHYRNLDVSTVKELAARWVPNIKKALKKESTHLALNDVYDSIEELRYYREYFFVIKE